MSSSRTDSPGDSAAVAGFDGRFANALDPSPGVEAGHPLHARATIGVAIAAGWALWGTISTLRLVGVPGLAWQDATWYGFPDALIWAGLTPLLVRISRRFPVRFHASGKGKLASSVGFHLLAALGFGLLHAALDASLASMRNWAMGNDDPLWIPVFFKVLYYGFHTNLLVYALVVGIAQSVDRARGLAAREQRATELEARLAEARLASLEQQLRPHFLFNALNTVSGLMGDDAEEGRRVVRQLGDLLRASLKPTGGTVSLAEELDLARSYLAIEKARFGDRLRTEIVLPADLANHRVPALLLQPLVENAVIHGIGDRPGGGHVRVRARQAEGYLELTVEDDGPGLDRHQLELADLGRPGMGNQAPALEVERAGRPRIGLANVRQRLGALYGEGPWFELESGAEGGKGEGTGQGLRVTVRLPDLGTREPSP